MIFIDNKYTRWYYSIIEKAQNRVIEGYIEKHHIIPKSLSGSNAKSNLVKLTAREHFVCHLLLPKMTIGADQRKMAYAAWQMTMLNDRQRYLPSSRIYAVLRKWLSETRKGVKFTAEHRANLSKGKKGRSNGHKGMKRSEETKAKQRAAKQHISEETREKMRFNANNRTAEHRQKIIDANLGRKVSEETRKRMSESNKGHPGWNKGKQHSLETREKMRLAHSNRKRLNK